MREFQVPVAGSSVMENMEAGNERAEALTSLLDEFRRNVIPKITEHENTARVVFDQKKGYDDDLKRKALAQVQEALTKFETGAQAISAVFTKHGYNLNGLLATIRQVKERLIAAPDVRYSHAALVEKYEGAQNIPGEKVLDSWEVTQEYITKLKSTVDGLDIALQFLNQPPKK